jgi:hypothetical protein
MIGPYEIKKQENPQSFFLTEVGWKPKNPTYFNRGSVNKLAEITWDIKGKLGGSTDKMVQAGNQSSHFFCIIQNYIISLIPLNKVTMKRYVITASFGIEWLIWSNINGGSWFREPYGHEECKMVVFNSETEASDFTRLNNLIGLPIQRDSVLYTSNGLWRGAETIYPVEDSIQFLEVIEHNMKKYGHTA